MDQLSENETSSVTTLKSVCPSDKESHYDHNGAMYFTIAVVLVYGLSIVALIATHMKRRHGETKEESKQVSAYIQNQASIKRRGENEQLLWLQRELVGADRQKPTGQYQEDSRVSGSNNPSRHLTPLPEGEAEAGRGRITPAPFCSSTCQIYPIPDGGPLEPHTSEYRDWLNGIDIPKESTPFISGKNRNNNKALVLTKSNDTEIAPSRNLIRNEYREDIFVGTSRKVGNEVAHSGEHADSERSCNQVVGLCRVSPERSRKLLEPKSSGAPANRMCTEQTTDEIWMRRTESV